MMRRSVQAGLGLAVTALLLAACSEPKQPVVDSQTAPPAASPAKTQALHINWFDGPVTEAFTRARDAGKPVFLYWGAVWCPPCNVIKSTVFNQPDFIRQTRDYIAVYLDGDTEDAQRWGEHYSAMGYPTLIVFDAQGQELTRLSTGMEPARYREVLQLSQQGGQGVPALVQQVRQQPESLSQEQWQLLAWHSWPVDQGKAVASEAKADLFAYLAMQCPQKALAQRFALLAALQNVGQIKPDSKEQAALFALLDDILNDEAAWRRNLSELQYDGAALVMAATQAATYQRSRMSKLYQAALQAAWSDESLPLKQRMNSLYGLADLAQAGDQPASEEFQQDMQKRVAWLRQQDLTPQQRQSMMPGAAHMLHQLGLSDTAREIFQQEMQQSIAPYYYMAYLAGLERDLGNNEAALDWSRKAWQGAEGPATRTQWGLAHLGRLLDLQPEAQEQVISVLRQVFDTLAQHPGAFYQRSRVRLERMLPRMQTWAGQGDKQSALQALGPSIEAACAALPSASPSRALCQRWQQLLPVSAG